jgi:zinc protease
MIMLKRLVCIVIALGFIVSCTQKRKYETKTAESNGFTYEYVTDDPLKVRIYTLKNGLKVYLSQYQSEPRIQTQIAVKAGGKNDPAETTGLAHYLEHIMFKGTSDFGTLDWQKESILLDSVESMFEHYRTLTDSVERKNYYKLIDKVSNEASKLAIANEYDKMVSEIGARGTNAYTTDDRTVYINDIPANQIENWIRLEANRFKVIVPRLFHTELETVYEEKNRSLDNDYWKTFEAMNASIFKKHPYGTQTVIGTIDHLKNPSITNIKAYFNTYYRPNNVAVCLSGDIDYDKTIALIDKYFGGWQPNDQLPVLAKVEEEPITEPRITEVFGPDAEWVNLGFRFKGTGSEDAKLLRLTDMILSNSQAGLIDLNLKQQQKVLEPYSFVNEMNDYAIHTFSAKPREGQTLEQVKDLLLSQIELVKKGEFDDWLVDAVINDLKKSKIQQSEQNWSRSNDLVMSFTTGMPWQDYISSVESLKAYSKEDIVKFANEHYGNNYAVVYKRNGKDPNAKKVSKPEITRVTLNKEDKSAFHEELLKSKPEKLTPVFIDYDKDIQKLSMNKGVQVLYTPNKENELFTLYYLSDVGTNHDPTLKIAIEYLEYLGTSTLSAEEFKKELYKIGCSFGVFAAEDQTYIYLNGLSENMDKAVQLFEQLLADPKPDDEALKNMVDGIFKKRDDIKKDKFAILYEGLINYGLYGPESPFTNVLTNKELRELKAETLTELIKGFTQTEHKVLYYGPKSGEEIVASMNQFHVLPDQLKPAPAPRDFPLKDVTEQNAFWANYDMVQAEIIFLTKGPAFDKERIPISTIFNEYFDGNMSSPIFQELREAQGLAYSAFAFYGAADKPTGNDFFYGYVGTQADKQEESMKGLSGLIRNFPRTEGGFEVAKSGIMNRIESARITKTGILFNYLDAQRKGINHDIRKDVYEQAQQLTLDDIQKFHEQYLSKANYNVVVLGSEDKLNLKDLKNYGTVKQLTLDEIFGYEKPLKINKEASIQ